MSLRALHHQMQRVFLYVGPIMAMWCNTLITTVFVMIALDGPAEGEEATTVGLATYALLYSIIPWCFLLSWVLLKVVARLSDEKGHLWARFVFKLVLCSMMVIIPGLCLMLGDDYLYPKIAGVICGTLCGHAWLIRHLKHARNIAKAFT